jgi:hypothetical protein
MVCCRLLSLPGATAWRAPRRRRLRQATACTPGPAGDVLALGNLKRCSFDGFGNWSARAGGAAQCASEASTAGSSAAHQGSITLTSQRKSNSTSTLPRNAQQVAVQAIASCANRAAKLSTLECTASNSAKHSRLQHKTQQAAASRSYWCWAEHISTMHNKL